jgi:hypothetical protein
MPDQEAETEIYLKSNGPPAGSFELSDQEELLLDGKTEFEKVVLKSSLKSNKQNAWLIAQVVGLKGAHRVIHTRLKEGDEQFARTDRLIAQRLADENERFAKIEETLHIFMELRNRWLSHKKIVRHVIVGLVTLFILPFLSLLMVEVMKHFLHWP